MSEGRIQNWTEPMTLVEFAAASVGGKGAVCPGCGRQLFVYKTETQKSRIIRYEECQTPGCKRKFRTRQWHREIIEEIKPRDSKLSSPGNTAD